MIIAGAYLNLQQALMLQQEPLHYNGLSELKKIITSDRQRFSSGDLEDFRRANDSVRLAQLGALLTASDSPDWSADGTACIGWNGCGCTQANKTYWDDYLAYGRETGRGTFFVPTLPSIPACEAAITLKIHGPVWYFSTPQNTQPLFATLEDLLASTPALRQVLIAEIYSETACLLLWQPGGSEPDCQTLKDLFFQRKNEKIL